MGREITGAGGSTAPNMNLTDDQKQKVTSWIHEGLKLSEIQSRLQTDLGLQLTYMEVRFLVDDLRLVPKDPPAPPPTPVLPPASTSKTGPSAPPDDDDVEPTEAELMPGSAPAGTTKVSVTVDKLAVPGAIVSGSVTFSDGKTAQWYLDEMGRLGVAAKEKGYRPLPQDMQTFQLQLQRELQRMGF